MKFSLGGGGQEWGEENEKEDLSRQRMNKLEGTSIQIIQTEEEKEKRMKKT